MDIAGTITSLLSGSAITYTLGWLAGRKKNKADLESVRLKNLESSIHLYKTINDEFKSELNRVSARFIGLSTEIELVRKGNVSLENEIILLRQGNSSLQNEVGLLRKENVSLKNEIRLLNERLQKTSDEKTKNN